MNDDHQPDLRDPRPDHLRAWEALPWVVNGRATPEQARWVADHVAGCEDCRAELAWQQRLHDALAGPGEAATADPATEAGLQRLLARLDDVADEPQPAPVIAAASRTPHRLTWALAAAVVVQAVGLGVMSLQLGTAGDNGANGANATYRTLSEGAGLARPSATLRVLPDATMTLAQWQTLLQTQGLQVVNGPNASGAYALAPSPGTPARPRDMALAQLRASPGIRLAEPIGAAP
jgi:hypothetical protein